MTKVVDSSLNLSEFELQSLYYIHFRTITHEKSMNPIIPPAMCEIISLHFFYKNWFGIE